MLRNSMWKVKVHGFLKSFFLCCVLSLFYLLFSFIFLSETKYSDENLMKSEFSNINDTENELINLVNARIHMETDDKEVNLKHILIWTNPTKIPLVYMGTGRQKFLKTQCPYTNCYVTANRSYLGDYTKFDAIVMYGPDLIRRFPYRLPINRSLHQKFVFASMESADYYPICSNKFDDVFNWTWTYRFDSDILMSYIVVRDSEKNIIGPKTEMKWIKFKDMAPVSNELREKLQTKSRPAAWFVSNCHPRSNRNEYVRKLRKEMNKYGLDIDVYGSCGQLYCPINKSEECNKMIEKHYFFYLSFENSFAEDYVTEKLLYPLQNLAIPIVFGGANYTRFMPDGIYLNARELGQQRVVKKMRKLIDNFEMYIRYFKWRNHYSYHSTLESVETDEFCKFCAILNDEEMVKNITTYQNFKKWWNPPFRC